MKCQSKCKINITLIILLIVAVIIQLNSTYRELMDEVMLKSEFLKQSIEKMMGASIQQLSLLGMLIEDELSGTARQASQSVLFDGRNYESELSDSSLIGVADSGRLDNTVKSEINDILSHQEMFKQIKGNLKNIEWIYYLSENGFINVFPKTAMKGDEFIPVCYTYEFYKLAQPEANPNREVRFTKVYEDLMGKGNMITITLPIYDDKSFRGALAVDYTLKELSVQLNHEATSLYDFLIVNEYNQVIASDELDASNQQQDLYFKERFGLNPEQIKTDEITAAGDFYILVLPLDGVPLRLYVVVNRMAFYLSVIGKIIPIIASLIGILVILRLYYKTVNINDSLEKSERKFRDVFDQSAAFAVILDDTGRLIYANKSALRMIGKSIESVRDRNFAELDWWQHSEELKEFIDGAVRDVINGDFVKKDVLQIDLKKTEHFLTLTMFGIRDDMGKLDYIAATGIEITDRKLMENRLEGLSKTDLLTETYNRRGMYEMMDRSVNLFRRKGTPFVVMICDIDYFKNINDNYGHMVGDEILRDLVTLLKKFARPYDVVSRWGGEEFTLLLEDTEIGEGVKVAERIRREISRHPFRSDLTSHVVYLNITVGVKAYDPAYDIRQILKMADDALYHGKENGRNQVVNYDEIHIVNP